MNTYEGIQARTDEMQGWLRPAQARRLWDLASAVPASGTIVEIGSFHGKSTVVLASAATDSAAVYAIDPHAGNDRGPGEWDCGTNVGEADRTTFLENLDTCGVRDRVVVVREFSQKAQSWVPTPIDLLYVDGAHGYAPARSDIRDWGGRVVPDGTMAIHDVYTSMFVTLAVIRSLWFSTSWTYVGRVRSMAVYERRKPRGAELIRNVARQVINIPWLMKNLIVRGLSAIGLARLASLGNASGGGVY